MQKIRAVRNRMMTFLYKFTSPIRRAFLPFRIFARVKPISSKFGMDRGTSLDRFYIMCFLQENKDVIYGHVLEIGDDSYTKKIGGIAVIKSDVLHVCEGNKKATIIADLTAAPQIPSASFDCIILTQTLQFIYDFKAAIRELHRILKPGGVLLVTVSGISQISRYDMDRWGEFWRFTDKSAHDIFAEEFGFGQVDVCTYGNVKIATAFLQGLAVEDLCKKDFEFNDKDYQVIISVKAMKKLQGQFV